MIINTQFTQNIVRACSMFHPYEGYRSVTPLNYKMNSTRRSAFFICIKSAGAVWCGYP